MPICLIDAGFSSMASIAARANDKTYFVFNEKPFYYKYSMSMGTFAL